MIDERTRLHKLTAVRMIRIAQEDIYLKQHPDEIGWAMFHIGAHIGLIEHFVEIGSMAGASYYIYSGLCGPGAKAITIEDGRRGPATRSRLKRAIKLLQNDRLNPEWIRGSSHSKEALDSLKEILAGAPIDFLHIDGDHSAAGSWQDWEMYSPLMRPGGIVAFHDIRARTPCHVDEAWSKVRLSGHLTRETCRGRFPKRGGSGSHKPCGIGLVYM